ncbi:MAG: enoyl-CoA hydratase/isomerase family protein, partial [Candidatus Melainabacteria bacterium]|nr:enoyl-CoA hydratase/isomerase family protein [Candidatus Melainabacteria bacterium]
MTQTSSAIILRQKASGIGILLIDCPGKANFLTRAVMSELGAVLDCIKDNPEMKALVVLSGKSDSFVLGADLHEIIKITSESQAYQMSKQGQEVLAKFASLGKPTVVGIHGQCLGGGLELALWCRYRIATTDPSTVLALPEIRLGIVPGLGGTQLLPRLIGAKAALEIVFSSEPISAAHAKDIGLVDELVCPDDFLPRLEAKAQSMVSAQQADSLGSCNGLTDLLASRAINLSPEKQATFFAMAERSVRIKTKGNYPAHTRVIQLMKDGLSQGLEIGLELEAKAFGELAVSDVARNLQVLFFSTEYAKRGATLLSRKTGQTPALMPGCIEEFGGGLHARQTDLKDPTLKGGVSAERDSAVAT